MTNNKCFICNDIITSNPVRLQSYCDKCEITIKFDFNTKQIILKKNIFEQNEILRLTEVLISVVKYLLDKDLLVDDYGKKIDAKRARNYLNYQEL